MVDAPIRSALTRGSTETAATFTFTPDVKGTYLVSLRVNGSSADSDNAKNFIAVVAASSVTTRGWRYLASDEDLQDNTIYTGLSFPSNINTRGWATNEDLILEDIEVAVAGVYNALTVFGGSISRLVKTDASTGKIDASLIAGGPPTGSAGGDLTGTYPNPTVARLRGRALNATFNPSTGDTIFWDGSAFTPSAPTLQRGYNGGATITVASSTPVLITGDATTFALDVENSGGAPGLKLGVNSTSSDALTLQISSGDPTTLRRSRLQFSQDGDATIQVTPFSSGTNSGVHMNLVGCAGFGNITTGGNITVTSGNATGTGATAGKVKINSGTGANPGTIEIGVTNAAIINSGSGTTVWTHSGYLTYLTSTEIVSATTYVLLPADNGKIKKFTNASGCTVTVPHTLTVGISIMLVQDTGAGSVTLDDNAAQTTFIAPTSSATPKKTFEVGATIGITMTSSATALIYGNLA